VKSKISLELKHWWYPNNLERGDIERNWRKGDDPDAVARHYVTLIRSAQLPLEPTKSIQDGTWDCKDDGYTNHLGDAKCFICGRPRLS